MKSSTKKNNFKDNINISTVVGIINIIMKLYEMFK